MSCIIVFFVFGVLNAKYLAFRTSDTSTLILGWQGFFYFLFRNFVFVKFLSWVVTNWVKLIKNKEI